MRTIGYESSIITIDIYTGTDIYMYTYTCICTCIHTHPTFSFTPTPFSTPPISAQPRYPAARDPRESGEPGYSPQTKPSYNFRSRPYPTLYLYNLFLLLRNRRFSPPCVAQPSHPPPFSPLTPLYTAPRQPPARRCWPPPAIPLP